MLHTNLGRAPIAAAAADEVARTARGYVSLELDLEILRAQARNVHVNGHTLVVDGANWQRRSMTNPPVVTVREQMGKGPFEA